MVRCRRLGRRRKGSGRTISPEFCGLLLSEHAMDDYNFQKDSGTGLTFAFPEYITIPEPERKLNTALFMQAVEYIEKHPEEFNMVDWGTESGEFEPW